MCKLIVMERMALGELIRLARQRRGWTQTVARDGSITTGKPKRESSARVVKLSAPCVAVLKGHRARQNERRLAEGPWYDPGGLVFPAPDGRMQSRDRARHVLKQAARAAGVQAFSTHGLRHSSATLAIKAGAPIKVVLERLGHARASLTMDIYVHTNLDEHSEAAEALGEAFGRAAAEG